MAVWFPPHWMPVPSENFVGTICAFGNEWKFLWSTGIEGEPTSNRRRMGSAFSPFS